ncbi:hypothetical protein B9Z55_008222 [Caenorhabditis nigoni]|uniref:Uncharacterized protein n=1 Tax=Caenorhabditis nigoni TaxID=1611254 RepID=A0A2G5VD66_9PELO|nr:hypothetical protein B9Z55_008222 [Caenorhabditis nigoni]
MVLNPRPIVRLYQLFGDYQDHLEEWIRRKAPAKQGNGDVEITGIGLSAVESKSIRGVPKGPEEGDGAHQDVDGEKRITN